MKRIIAVFMVLSLAVAGGAFAQSAGHGKGAWHGAGGPHGMAGPGGPHGESLRGLERNLFAPELILRNQIALGLTDQQLTSIKAVMDEAHSGVMDVHTDLSRVVERLEGILEATVVDEEAALATAQEAMALEMKVKKTHLSVMIRIKNVLTEEQQLLLREMRHTAR